MFIDNPRDNSFSHANAQKNAISIVQIQEVQTDLAAQKNAISEDVAAKIKHLSIAKPSLTMHFSGQLNAPLKVSICFSGQSHQINSTSLLTKALGRAIDAGALEKRFKSFKQGAYLLDNIDCSALDEGLSVPFKELTEMKKEVAFLLNGQVKLIAPVNLPVLENHPKVFNKAKLSVLISSVDDIYLSELSSADMYFKLPESFKKNDNYYIDVFLKHPHLIPWFPAVLIGKDYLEAVRLLEVVKPQQIVSNNTGVAFAANKMGIQWIAGPFLNTTNSHALLTLQEELDCSGAFISNELNNLQLRNIKRPKNFKLLYSIYHPILMMTSRQCFFQQTVGCKKAAIEDGCMLKCEKATTITNVKGFSFAVDKQKGGYPSIYNNEQFLNLQVIDELASLFDEFFIDLTNIGMGDKSSLEKADLMRLFNALISADSATKQEAKTELDERVLCTTDAQYVQGL